MLPQRRGPNARVRRGTARRKSARGDDQGIADEMNELCEPEETRVTASCANKMRTAPLWALRTRNRLMHDGLSYTREDAIERHAGQAAGVTSRYKALPAEQRRQLLAFLDSL